MKVYVQGVTTGYKIKDVADRSGFSAATLRYCDQVGLLPESARTAAGYRLYDDQALERLAFIARAKQLGCSLDEIADLATAWDGGQCGPVQDRLRALIADKLTVTRDHIANLTTLAAELRQAAAALEQHRPQGRCDERCGCVTETTNVDPAVRSQALSLIAKPSITNVPIVCTLNGESLRGRVDDWQALLAHVERRDAIDGGVRAQFGPSAPLEELMRLVAAEQDCCQFFLFAITVDTRGVALEVRAPHDALPIVHSLFGDPS